MHTYKIEMPSGMVIIQKRRILILTYSLLDEDKDNACYDYTVHKDCTLEMDDTCENLSLIT